MDPTLGMKQTLGKSNCWGLFHSLPSWFIGILECVCVCVEGGVAGVLTDLPSCRVSSASLCWWWIQWTPWTPASVSPAAWTLRPREEPHGMPAHKNNTDYIVYFCLKVNGILMLCCINFRNKQDWSLLTRITPLYVCVPKYTTLGEGGGGRGEGVQFRCLSVVRLQSQKQSWYGQKVLAIINK